MNTLEQNAQNNNTETTQPTACNASPFTLEQLQGELCNIEAIGGQFRSLLVKYEDTLRAEGIREQVEIMERWLESYRRGLRAAVKISEMSPTWLTELHDRLQLAAEELQRLEDEGGNPATPEQLTRAEDLRKASRRIVRVMPYLQNSFPQVTTAAEDSVHA